MYGWQEPEQELSLINATISLSTIFKIGERSIMQGEDKKRVLMISPLMVARDGTQILAGGIASWTKQVFDNQLSSEYEPYLVNTRFRGKRLISEERRWLFSEAFRTVRILGSLLYKLVKIKPQLVHLNCSLSPVGIFRDWICSALTRFFDIPVVIQYRRNVADFPRKKYKGLPFWALRHLILGATQNIVLNRPSYDQISKIDRRPDLPLALIPNFVDDQIFEYQVTDHGSDQLPCRIIYVGSIQVAKGCREILEVARHLPDLDFVLVGSVAANMNSDVQSAPENVTIVEKIDRSAVIDELCASQIFFFPSHSEGFPNAVLEAMSVGLPVIATNVGAIPEMMESGSGGFLVECGDIPGMVNSLRILGEDPDKRMQMGHHNRKRSHLSFRYSTITDQLTDIYDRLLLYNRILKEF